MPNDKILMIYPQSVRRSKMKTKTFKDENHNRHDCIVCNRACLTFGNHVLQNATNKQLFLSLPPPGNKMNTVEILTT